MDSCDNENDYACAVNFLNFQYGLKNKDCPQNLVDVYYKGAFEETQYKGAKYLADDHIKYFVWFPGNTKMVIDGHGGGCVGCAHPPKNLKSPDTPPCQSQTHPP